MLVVPAIWDTFLTLIREEVGSRVVETWFKAVMLREWDPVNKIVYMEVPNGFVKDWISNNYLSLMQFHLGRLLHVDSPQVVLHAKPRVTTTDAPRVEEPRATLMNEPKSAPQVIAQKKTEVTPARAEAMLPNVPRNYSFENFVVGPDNSLAYAAARAVTEQVGTMYNPLFIHAGSGLGKTHLLHAIGHRIKMQHKNAAILYQTTDRFVHEFISAIRFDKVHAFQAKYQKVDVLLMDDVHFISNKEQTQDAFFHIFNDLYGARKQIVLSSDVLPQNIKGLSDRLQSRWTGGLVTDIQNPCLETKIAILNKKAELNHAVLPDEVVHFIAARATSNIRELEGALVRVMAFASLTKQTISLELARRVLYYVPEVESQAIDLERIMQCVTKYFPFTPLEIKSKGRNKDLVLARHIAVYLMKQLTEKSLREIGTFMGGRDHATIMHGLSKMHACIEGNPQLRQKISSMEMELKG